MKIVQYRYFLLFLFSLISFISFSQTQKLYGLVLDSVSHEPLAFVNIVYNADNLGTSSNIDGKFIIESKSKIEFLKFSYLGYKPLIIYSGDIRGAKVLTVFLNKESLNLDEVTILPGINPAHRIINKVIGNKELNNPEKLTSFSYISYNKMYFTADLKNKRQSVDTIILNESQLHYYDSLEKVKKNTANKSYLFGLFNTQHLFLMESVSERIFSFPDKNHEKIIATKVSGLQSPAFVILATQLQSFSFYKEMINISDKYYLSPVSNGSTRKYLFIIEDTLYSELQDTVFVISYRPSKGKNFEGLQGVLNINSRNYAIESVVAEPYDQSKVISFRIQQKYKLIENKQWFPFELNTDMFFTDIKMPDKTDTVLIGGSKALRIKKNYPLMGIGKTYLQNISLDTVLKKKDFSVVELDFEEDAHKKDEELWNYYRHDSLTVKEIKTYHVIDSIGKKANLDFTVRLSESMAMGYIPISVFNLEYKRVLNFNEYEGWRFGLGLMTNDKILKWLSVGGYYAYGLRDKENKYGGKLIFNIEDNSDLKLNFSYANDLNESGGSYFINNIDLNSTEMYRNYLLRDIYHIEQEKVELAFRTLKYLKTEIAYSQNRFSPTNNYLYDDESTSSFLQNQFESNEISMRLRYAYKEKFMNTPMGNKVSIGTKYPIFWANIIKGIDIGNNSLEYLKLEARLYKSFVTKALGKSIFTIIGGYIDNPLPYLMQYNGRGSYQQLAFETSNSFATMRMNEFVSDKFVYLFFQHDFSSLIFKTETFKPRIVFCQNVGYGSLSNPSQHFNIPYKTMEDIYLESGVLLKNLIKEKYFGFGCGVYYRYGKYELPKLEDNLAFKLTFNFDI